jgi:hypothetical protein
MASQTDICNTALTMLGANTINAISDQSNQARTLNAIWNVERDNELRANRWKFAILRTTLPALATKPVSGPYTQAFQLPQQYLRALEIGDSYAGADMSDYRSGPTTADYSIEGGMILTNLPAPLSFRYIVQITDPGLFDPAFAKMFACRLASVACFRLTNSNDMKKVAMQEYKDALMQAMRANALETPPTFLADDTWVAARLGDGGTLARVNF